MDLPGLLQSALGSAYRIERPLGRGGMATVWLAHDLRHDRPVALKVLHPELAQTLGPERFDREVKLAARLQHPHILTVLDSGEASGHLWFTMPFVDGESLRDRLTREGQLPLEEAVRITREAAAALDYSHRHGVVHRDIKPENILLTRDGDALVADFGIARALGGGDEAPLTQTGMAVGTPAYMSPEQASGGAVDVRTDIYSLGSVLYEMLAGEPPFTGPTAQAIMARRFSEPVRPLRAVRETVSAGLEHAVLKALARAPADRFASAAEFSRALALATGATTPGGGTVAATLGPPAAIPPAAGRESEPAHRRWRGHRALSGLAALLVLATGGWAIWHRSRVTAGDVRLDPSTLAVLPFRAAGPGLDLWREGLVDLVSMNLDGAAGLRSVPPRTVLSQWHRQIGAAEADQERTLGVARGLGARYVLTGSIVGSGASVRLSAEMIDLASGAAQAKAQTEGPADSVPAMVDRLTLELLRNGLPDRSGGRIAPAGEGTITRSLPALKHYLTGERLFRGGQADSAVTEYEGALAADSTFALAAYRLVVVPSWSFSPHPVDGFPPDALDRLLRLADRLPPREAAVTRVLPLLQHALISALPPLERLVEQYPSDAEAWFQYGDALFHLGGAAGQPREAFRQALRRATELDPGLGFAYVHLAEDAFDRGDSSEVGRIVSALRRTDASSPKTTGIALAFAEVWGDSAARRAVRAALDTASSTAIITAKHDVDLTPDLLQPTLVFAAALAEPRHSRDMQGSANGGRAFIYRAVGRMRESRDALATALPLWGFPSDEIPREWARYDLWDFLQGVVDTARADRAYAYLSGQPDSVLDPEVLGRYAAVRGRWKDIPRYLRAIATQTSHAAGDSLMLPSLAADDRIVRAYVAEGHGEHGAVVRALLASVDAYPQANGENGPQLRLELARRLLDAHDFRGAERYLRSFDIGTYNITVLRGQVELYLGRVAEGLSDRETAKARYGNVVRWWGKCDPELVPLREEAREALSRLTAEPAGTRGTE
jgi:serine/threonine-protein kinase